VYKTAYKISVDGKCQNFQDYLIEDRTITLYVDGKFFEQFHCLPEDLEELALGNLLYKGIKPIRWDFYQDDDQVYLKLHVFEKVSPQPLRNTNCVSAKVIIQAMNDMLQDPLHTMSGAVHIAGLYTNEGERLVRFEDVGRHNAVDKVIGWLTKNAIDPSYKILLCSGRLPLEMALKSVLAGVEILASKAPVMASAIDFSERFNLTLIGFVRENRLNVYTHPQRIKEVRL
jgi:FdhD protein